MLKKIFIFVRENGEQNAGNALSKEIYNIKKKYNIGRRGIPMMTEEDQTKENIMRKINRNLLNIVKISNKKILDITKNIIKISKKRKGVNHMNSSHPKNKPRTYSVSMIQDVLNLNIRSQYDI
jgi:hypothetical protein